jgi:ribonuclease P protein component
LTFVRTLRIGPPSTVVRQGAAFFRYPISKAMSDEAHVSTEQPGPRPPSRLPRAYGDGRRTRSHPRSPRARPGQAFGLSNSEVGRRSADPDIASARLLTLTERRDFLAANAGKRAPMPGFVLLVRHRDDGDPAMRVGFTVTKKIGGAVVRNRMKRRFRALARELLPTSGIAGADHVLIGRAGGVERNFANLRAELAKALARLAR